VERLLELIVQGAVVGALYALVALGFVLVYKASQVVNFAQGELVMLGGYLGVVFTALYGLPWPLAFALAIGISALAGVAIERTVLRPLIGRPLVSVVMATIALATLIRGLLPAIWGPSTMAYPQLFPRDPVAILGAPVSQVYLAALVFTILFIVVFGAFFKTRLGIAMQAVADNQRAAASLGISVRRVFALSWAIAGVVAAAAGIVWGILLGVDNFLALLGLRVFAVVILGGLDSIVGAAIVGGVTIGILENLAGAYVDPLVGGGFRDTAPFIILVLALMIKPYGLFGREEIERV
jgi:branched-chain amino acid transport system permease protein